MPINYKDINELTEETNIAGTEKVPVSGTKYVIFNKIKEWIINSLKTTGLDLGGKGVKNVSIDVVSSLPTAPNNFIGRQVTYQGKSYIWDGSAWKCDSDYLEIGGRNLIKNNFVAGGNTTLITNGVQIIAGANSDTYFYLKPALDLTKYANKTITLSFWVDGITTGAFLFTWKNNFSNISWRIQLKNGLNTLSFIDDTLSGTGDLLFDDISRTSQPTSINLTYFKLEKGNIATDWTPAPEDKADVGHNHDSDYLGISDTAADSDKLGGYDLSYFKKGVGKGSYYKDVVNISFHGTAEEILIKTKIPFLSSSQMPLIHLEGYAYGDASPIELRIAFYIYASSFVVFGCTSTCPWNPTIKLFTYVDNSTTYVGIALIKSIYFPQCTINYIDVWGGGSGVQERNYSENWTIEYNTVTTPSIVPTDNLASVPYRPIANSITGNAATATNSDLLDGKHASEFATSTHNHDTVYLGKTAKAADSDKLDGKDSTDFALAGHGHGYMDGDGAITTEADIATGDRIIIADRDDGDKLNRTSISFDTANTRFLREDGKWYDTPLPGAATATTLGSIKIGYSPDSGSPGNLPVLLGNNDNLNKAFVSLGDGTIKDVLGLVGYDNNNSQDIFISGKLTPPLPDNDFNLILNIGSYKVSGAYKNAPEQDCGTNIGTTASMVGSLNVFRSGVNNWETIQQLFWVLNGKTEQYQRSYNGTAWTIWKRLIKCDDYADTSSRGGIISQANMQELFRTPDLIQLWNEDILSLIQGTYYLDSLVPIGVPIENSIHIDSGNENNIMGLTSGRRYRVTYEVQYKRIEGEGEVTIKIENRYGEIYSATDSIFNYELRKRTTFSVIITGTEVITPSIIVVGSELDIEIYLHDYQVSVEEIKFPYFTPNPV